MLLDDDYDARMEQMEGGVKSEIEPLLRPSLDRSSGNHQVLGN